MSDSQWGMIITFLIIAGTRILDTFLPEGYIAKIVTKYMKKKPKDTPKDD